MARRSRDAPAALLALLVGACAAPPPAAPQPPSVAIEAPAEGAPEPDVAPLVTDAKDYDEVQPAAAYLTLEAAPARRARLAWYGSLFAVEPDRESAALNPHAERNEAAPHAAIPVVEERPSSVRLLIEDDGVRLVAYVRHEDLRPVVQERARVSLGVARPPVDGGPDGVWIRAGVAASKDRDGGYRAVPIDDDAHHGEAWVSPEAIGWTYQPERDEAAEENVSLVPGTIVRAAAGAALYTVSSEGLEVQVVTRSARRTRIRYQSEALVIEGWVEGGMTEVHGLGALGTGGGFGWGSSGDKRVLHRGDRLHERAGAEVIGLVTGERVTALDGQAEDGGRTVEVHLSGWSFVSLWIAADDVDFGERWERAFQSRARLEPATKATLPRYLRERRDEAMRCWTTALDDAAHGKLSLRLTWKGGGEVEVPRPAGLDAALHACLTEAFSKIEVPPPLPPLPLPIWLYLEPTPLPTR